jgi:hypothetical protein
MAFMEDFRTRVLNWMFGSIDDAYTERVDYIMDRREYRVGLQKKFIKIRPNQPDDNLTMNFIGLIIERSVSMLFGNGIQFEYGEDEEAQAVSDDVWNANDKNILLHRLGTFGADGGMCFVKVVPREGEPLRLVALDPSLLDIHTDPDDWEKVTAYVIQYKTMKNGKEIGKREVTELDESGLTWTITQYENTAGKWIQVDIPVVWEYDFPPINHWQNLPNVMDAWGMPDISNDVLRLQDRINFVSSNISKIIRMYAHPQRWGRGLGQAKKITLGPDDIVDLGPGDSMIDQLESVGDMGASLAYLNILRQSLMDITRTVDISSLHDKLGALTNFGLRVLYQDALQKLGTKRELYEEGLQELNKRILILSGMEDPPECVIDWPNPMPENESEEAQAVAADLNMGIVSKQTISEKREYDWETEQSRMDEERAAGDNLGASLLRAFDSTGGV